jgi:hypothetical protein
MKSPISAGANEYWNDEAGHTWLNRARAQWADHLWINPVPEAYWDYTQSIGNDPRDIRKPNGANDPRWADARYEAAWLSLRGLFW